jgi:hypothetical protein
MRGVSRNLRLTQAKNMGPYLKNEAKKGLGVWFKKSKLKAISSNQMQLLK